MFCPKCGGNIPDEFSSFLKDASAASSKNEPSHFFCPKCGQPIPEEYLNYSIATAAPKKGRDNSYDPLKPVYTPRRPTTASKYVKPMVRGNLLSCPICAERNISATAAECPHCHAQFIPTKWKCPKCSNTNSYATSQCIYCGGPFTLRSAHPSYHSSTYGKKWFHWLIYFSLFASGIVNILSGLILFASDPLQGLFTCGLGIFYFYVRYLLAHFKKIAPAVYLWSQGIVAALQAVFTLCDPLGAASMSSSDLEVYNLLFHTTRSDVEQMIISTVLASTFSVAIKLFAEYVYFNKRKSWFNKD